jgi:hypothetical protein
MLGMWSASSSFLWTACLSSYLAFFLQSSIPSMALQSSVPWRATLLFCLLSFGYPTAIGVAVIAENVTMVRGDAGHVGCYITAEEPAWRLLTIFGPLWASMLVTVVCSARVAHKVSQYLTLTATVSSQRNVRMLRLKMLLIPLTFILQRGPGTVYVLLAYAWGEDATSSSEAGRVLTWLMAACNPIQGVSTSMIFIWSSPTYADRLRRRCCGWFPPPKQWAPLTRDALVSHDARQQEQAAALLQTLESRGRACEDATLVTG